MNNYFIKIGRAKSNTTCGYFLARVLYPNRYAMSIRLLSNKNPQVVFDFAVPIFMILCSASGMAHLKVNSYLLATCRGQFNWNKLMR